MEASSEDGSCSETISSISPRTLSFPTCWRRRHVHREMGFFPLKKDDCDGDEDEVLCSHLCRCMWRAFVSITLTQQGSNGARSEKSERPWQRKTERRKAHYGVLLEQTADFQFVEWNHNSFLSLPTPRTRWIRRSFAAPNQTAPTSTRPHRRRRLYALLHL